MLKDLVVKEATIIYELKYLTGVHLEPIAKENHCRRLNEPEEAESICRDAILR